MILALMPFTIIPSAFAENHEITVQPIPNSGSRIICGESLGVDCYTPNPITIDVGGKIIFSNTDSEPHFFTSGQISDNKIGLDFDSGLLDPNEIFIWNPKVVGDFPYFCPIHPWMQGVINVVQEISDNEQEEILKIPTTDVEATDSKPVELVPQPTSDSVEIDPEPQFVSEKPIIEKKVCTPRTLLTWECIWTFLHLEFSNYLNSLYKIFI